MKDALDSRQQFGSEVMKVAFQNESYMNLIIDEENKLTNTKERVDSIRSSLSKDRTASMKELSFKEDYDEISSRTYSKSRIDSRYRNSAKNRSKEKCDEICEIDERRRCMIDQNTRSKVDQDRNDQSMIERNDESMIERNDERSHKSTNNDHKSMMANESGENGDEIPEIEDSIGQTISEFVNLSHLEGNKDELGFELIYSINEQMLIDYERCKQFDTSRSDQLDPVDMSRFALSKLNTRSDKQMTKQQSESAKLHSSNAIETKIISLTDSMETEIEDFLSISNLDYDKDRSLKGMNNLNSLIDLDDEQVNTKQIGTKQVDTKQVDSKQVNSKQVDTKQVDTKQIDTKQIGTKQVDTKQVDSKQVNTKQVDSKQVNTKQIDTKQVDTKQVDIKQIDYRQANDKKSNIQVDRQLSEQLVGSTKVDNRQMNYKQLDYEQVDYKAIDARRTGNSKANEVDKDLRALKLNKSDNGPKSELIRCLDVEYNLELFEGDRMLADYNTAYKSDRIRNADTTKRNADYKANFKQSSKHATDHRANADSQMKRNKKTNSDSKLIKRDYDLSEDYNSGKESEQIDERISGLKRTIYTKREFVSNQLDGKGRKQDSSNQVCSVKDAECCEACRSKSDQSAIRSEELDQIGELPSRTERIVDFGDSSRINHNRPQQQYDRVRSCQKCNRSNRINQIANRTTNECMSKQSNKANFVQSRRHLSDYLNDNLSTRTPSLNSLIEDDLSNLLDSSTDDLFDLRLSASLSSSSVPSINALISSSDLLNSTTESWSDDSSNLNSNRSPTNGQIGKRKNVKCPKCFPPSKRSSKKARKRDEACNSSKLDFKLDFRTFWDDVFKDEQFDDKLTDFNRLKRHLTKFNEQLLTKRRVP